jgi:hypothetical protein
MPKVGIQANIELTPQGASFPQGWVCVSRADGNASIIHFDVDFYVSETAFDQGFRPVVSKSFSIPYQAGDLVELLHGYLLTLTLDESPATNPDSCIRCDLTQGQLVIQP